MAKELTPEQREKRNARKRRYVEKHREQVNAQRREYREQNKEKINEHNREYYAGYREENREHLKEKNKEWRDNNPELYHAHKKRSLEKPENRETAKQRTAAFRQTEFGAEYIVSYDREYRAIPAKRILNLCNGARGRAEKNGMEYDEDLYEYLIQDIPTHCPCCSVELDYSTGKGRGERRYSPSLDRVNNNIGYVRSNVKIVCWHCNNVKSDASLNELEALVIYMRNGLAASALMISGKFVDDLQLNPDLPLLTTN